MTTGDRIAGIEYAILEARELGAMAGLLAEAFSGHEPPAVAVGLSALEIEGVVRTFGDKAVGERLSLVARVASTGTLAGALLGEDFGTPPPAGLDDVSPRFAPIRALLDGLDERYRASRDILPGAYAHLFMVGVAQDYAGQGIAQQLVTRCLANARARGYRVAVTEATGTTSQHVFRKLGFREVLATRYQDFRFRGRRVFSSIVGPDATVLMERAL
ncbi:MAG: GNAT family N-acetyltransferase [Gemmatimonadaceae bacterium]|nr:GNAT family N-acetyltransferase [Gemmatimonadaceae bacterium]